MSTSEEATPQDATPENEGISVREFLEKVPPGTVKQVRDLRMQPTRQVVWPVIELYCETPVTCDGPRLFRAISGSYLVYDEARNIFETFVCRNCQKTTKTFALEAVVDALGNGRMSKFGEVPAFGPPTPARMITLIGPDKEFFLKGRRAENQGLGIAAFAYYRRVVENQKNRIYDEIIRVAQRVGVATPELLEDLTKAKAETQFTASVAAIKHAIPQVLLINGHNPLTLLHSALSEGLHAQTDEECLSIATAIRLVLVELAERLAEALKDHAELQAAMTKLLAKKKTL